MGRTEQIGRSNPSTQQIQKHRRGRENYWQDLHGSHNLSSYPEAYSRIPPPSALHKIFMNLFSPPLAVALSTLSSRVVWLLKACQPFNFYLNFDFFVSPTSI